MIFVTDMMFAISLQYNIVLIFLCIIKVIKRLWVICVLFFLCWLPRCIISLANISNLQRTMQDLNRIFNTNTTTNVQRRLIRISYLNSAMNPIVLFIMSKYVTAYQGRQTGGGVGGVLTPPEFWMGG